MNELTCVQSPQSRTVDVGQPAAFEVVATGAGALAYQWRRDGAPIAGATGASYQTAAATAADDGARFEVVVGDGAGELTCPPGGGATLHVRTGPPIDPASIVFTVVGPPQPVRPTEAGVMVHELKVGNVGAALAEGLRLVSGVPLQAMADLTSTSDGPACNRPYGGLCKPGGTLSWPEFSLAPGEVRTVRVVSYVQGNPADGTVLHQEASLGFGQTVVTRSTDTVVMRAATAGLALGVSPELDGVAPGVAVTYTLLLGNDDASARSLPAGGDGVLAVTLPPGLSFAAASAGGSRDGSTVRWSFGAVARGGFRRFTLTATVAPSVALGAVLTPTVEVTGGGKSLASATAATEVRAASPIRLLVTTDRDRAYSGVPNDTNTHVTYEYRIANTGAEAVRGLALADLTYGGLEVESTFSGAPGCSNTGSDRCLTAWPPFDLEPGEVRTLVLVKQLYDARSNQGGLARGAVTLATPFGRVARTADIVGAPDGLVLSMAADKDPVAAGNAVTYTLLLGNTYNVALPAAVGGSLSVRLPPGTTYQSSSTGGGLTGSVVRWSLGQVAAHRSTRFSLTVTVDGGVADGTLLPFEASAEDAAGGSLARAQAVTEVRSALPFEIEFRDPPSPVNQGDSGTFTTTIKNVGSDTLEDVSAVVRSLPSAYLYPTLSSPAATCLHTYGEGSCVVQAWSGLAVPPGQSLTLTWPVKVKTGTGNLGTILHPRLVVSAGNRSATHVGLFQAGK